MYYCNTETLLKFLSCLFASFGKVFLAVISYFFVPINIFNRRDVFELVPHLLQRIQNKILTHALLNLAEEFFLTL